MNDTSSPRLTERQKFWLDHLKACKSSCKAMSDYAREHGLSASGLYSARRALTRKGVLPGPANPRFTKARLAAPSPAIHWQVQLPNGATVSFGGEVPRETLALVLQTAAALS